MATIAKDAHLATLINVFTVEPKNQQKLVDMLVEATEKTMRRLPGFVSASIHKSTDGVRVTNYAQWRSAEDFAAMMKNPAALEHMKPIQAIATFDAHLYSVADSITLDEERSATA
jgi:heme-degrading monooxygenase HmoA